ncbi:LacI family DNA-binding transcriptional regulator [Allostreptomyces psammosilenae]|uniref:LacI family transcriptional regulator n=1 Tax=Allostreptomyces psammosilenae TaxID=1892865 RepID=A0A852ZWP2_9ACTN|nr:LacI family DNA-binding transcriptional regulator [Allostreptomyces psammosilenae]NYI05164.1 LacI family transcriptional regulator [Allostreptomyces psammosilenae]
MSDPEPIRKPATVRDVAALAGVSVKTVSRVINGVPSVSEELRSRVNQAIARLDFRPNLAASSLRRADGRTGRIALLLEDLANPFSATLHRAVEDVARRHRSLVLAGSLDEDPQREVELARALAAHGADGLIIAPASPDQGYLNREVRAGTPVVFVDRPPRGLTADAVLVDNVAGAAAAVRHLAEVGHRRIAYLGDYLSLPTASGRFRGYQEEMGRQGLPVPPELVRHDLHDVTAATEAAHELLTGPLPPTALFTSQNLVTTGAVRALRRLGLGHRVALVGFDDFPLADLLEPGVTVIAQDAARMGETAATLLFERVNGDHSDPREVVIPTPLLIRGSGEIPPPAER